MGGIEYVSTRRTLTHSELMMMIHSKNNNNNTGNDDLSIVERGVGSIKDEIVKVASRTIKFHVLSIMHGQTAR